MRNDLVVGIGGIDFGFEDLDFLTRDSRAPQTANQFFRLAGKHRAGNHFDPTYAVTEKSRLFGAGLHVDFFGFDDSWHAYTPPRTKSSSRHSSNSRSSSSTSSFPESSGGGESWNSLTSVTTFTPC